MRTQCYPNYEVGYGFAWLVEGWIQFQMRLTWLLYQTLRGDPNLESLAPLRSGTSRKAFNRASVATRYLVPLTERFPVRKTNENLAARSLSRKSRYLSAS